MYLQLYKFTTHLHSGKTAAYTLDYMHIIFTWIVHMNKYNFLVVLADQTSLSAAEITSVVVMYTTVFGGAVICKMLKHRYK